MVPIVTEATRPSWFVTNRSPGAKKRIDFISGQAMHAVMDLLDVEDIHLIG